MGFVSLLEGGPGETIMFELGEFFKVVCEYRVKSSFRILIV